MEAFRHKEVRFQGVPIHLDHLEVFQFHCRSERAGRDLHVEVRFSNHVYTKKFESELHLNSDIILRDSSGPRVFCPERFALSAQLRGVIQGLSDKKVTQNKVERNYVYAVSLDTQSGFYHVFFSLHRGKSRNADLVLIVESAYKKQTQIPNYNPPRRIKFEALATKVYYGEPVRFGFR